MKIYVPTMAYNFILKRSFLFSYEQKALITGITGQDGSYLAEFLLNKNYEVHGIKKQFKYPKNWSHLRILIQDNPKLFLHYGDLTDSSNILRLIQDIQPDEIYNLGAQSHVAVGFESPEYTANSDALGIEFLKQLRFLI